MKQLISVKTLLVISLIFLMGISPAWAGPNSSAGCAPDLDYETRAYDPEISEKDIEARTQASIGDEIWVAVVAQNVTNLDTYQAEVTFDPDNIAYLEGYEDNSFSGITNLLKNNAGTTIGFQAVENTPGTVNIANTLIGSDTDQAPEGTGIIALLKFRVIGGSSDVPLTLSNVKYMDSEGSNEPLVIDDISELGNAVLELPPPGDIYAGDREVNLKDAVTALKVLADMNPDKVYLSDINGDKKIGTEEVIYVLQVVANLRDS